MMNAMQKYMFGVVSDNQSAMTFTISLYYKIATISSQCGSCLCVV